MTRRRKLIAITLILFVIITIFIFVIIQNYNESELKKYNYTKNYPYPQLYEAFDNRCPALVDSGYVETPTPFDTFGNFTLSANGKKYAVQIQMDKFENKRTIIIFFKPNLVDFIIKPKGEFAMRYDMDQHKLTTHLNNFNEITPEQKSAFEAEIGKRLKQC